MIAICNTIAIHVKTVPPSLSIKSLPITLQYRFINYLQSFLCMCVCVCFCNAYTIGSMMKVQGELSHVKVCVRGSVPESPCEGVCVSGSVPESSWLQPDGTHQHVLTQPAGIRLGQRSPAGGDRRRRHQARLPSERSGRSLQLYLVSFAAGSCRRENRECV